jgi:hypothetical protein
MDVRVKIWNFGGRDCRRTTQYRVDNTAANRVATVGTFGRGGWSCYMDWVRPSELAQCEHVERLYSPSD